MEAIPYGFVLVRPHANYVLRVLFSGFRFPNHRPRWVVTYNESGTIEEFGEDDIREAIKLHRILGVDSESATTRRDNGEMQNVIQDGAANHNTNIMIAKSS